MTAAGGDAACDAHLGTTISAQQARRQATCGIVEDMAPILQVNGGEAVGRRADG